MFGREGGGGYGRCFEIRLLLAFRREGGSGYGGCVEMDAIEVVVRWSGRKKTTSRSRLDAREEVAVGDVSKRRENLAREVAAVAVR